MCRDSLTMMLGLPELTMSKTEELEHGSRVYLEYRQREVRCCAGRGEDVDGI